MSSHVERSLARSTACDSRRAGWRARGACAWAMALLAVIGLGARDAFAVTLTYAYRFDTSRVALAPAVGRSAAGLASQTLHAGDLPRTWERGRPEVPYDLVTLLVPRGSRLVGLRARGLGEHAWAEGVALAAAAPQWNDDGVAVLPPESAGGAGLDAFAKATAEYPAALVEDAGSGALHGYQLLSVRVYPLHYDAPNGRVLVTERIDLDVDVAPGGAEPIQRERYSAAIESAARTTLARLVANPEALDGYVRRIGTLVEKSHGGFHPSAAPSLEGSDVDYVIVTTDALAPSWQVLADWKTRRGVPTVVRTVEWIQANYRRGSDLQETIRTFVKDAYAKWGVQYVLLGGDTDLLPARYGFSAFGSSGGDQSIPSDLYFGCLDSNWNKDGDAVWGEPAASVSDPGDSTDLYAEVYVGRLPMSTVAEVNAIVTKVTTYENPTQTAYQNKTLLLGEVLMPVNWDSSQDITLDGADLCENLASEVGGCTTLKRLYEEYTNFPGSLPLTRQAAIDEMNAGYGFVNHVGHGFRYNMSCGDASLQNFNATALTNGDKRFVLYMLNCTATAFDFPCLAEAFLDAAGGAVGVLGASRSAFSLPSHVYNRNFFDAAYSQGYTHLGQLFAQSRLPQTPNAWLDTADHYSHLIYAFLGDPEMVLHTCTLGTTAATYPSVINLGLTNVTVNVTVDGLPRAGALVCLQKGTEEYQFGTTNGAGSVTLAFRAETAGVAQLTISGQNMKTLLGSVSALTGGQAYVRTQSVAIEDNAGAPSSGNADGVLDAGETIELTVVFHNSGSAAANGVTGKLRIPSPWVTVLDSTYSLANMAAGATATATNQVWFSVASNTPDGTVLPLTFVSTRSTSTYTDVVNRVVHAPAMRLTLLDVDDFAPGGNNDGIIQAGETFDLLAYFKNYGTGAADGLGATLASVDPDVTIFNGAVALGRCNPIAEITGATRFRVRETALAENAMTLTLTDNYGRALVSNITLRGPATPAAPVLDASTGADVVLVECTPNTEPDLAGYHVYRALGPGGPWTRATLDRTSRVAYFRNTGLAPSTRYYYSMTAVDNSGNESVRSAVASVSTNAAQLAGWPITLLGSSSCPVVVGDITGDGAKEIIAGNEHLYGWTAGGIELRDDDGDPQTWGVFVNEMKTVTGGPALAELSRASRGFEVFALSWDDSNKAFAVRGDGSILSGWPRNPDPTTSQKGYWANASAADVDGDGLDEVFAPAKNGNLYAWHANGTPLGVSQAFKTSLGTFARTAPSFANLDGDPYPEIVYGAPTGTLYVWNADGSNLAPFPKTPGTECIANTAIGDVNKDGVLDIVMITEGGAINVYNTKTGAQLPGWPKALPFDGNPKTPSPALADFDFDGFLEIVVAVNDVAPAQCAVRVYNYQGVLRPGWPVLTGGVTSESSPIVADVSGDGVPDILFGNEGGLVYGWNKDGVDLPGFPLTVGDFIRSTPYADDVDGDGNINLVLAGWDKNLYVWNFTAPWVAAAAQWPTLSHDPQRSGYYKHRVHTPTDVDGGGPGLAPPARAYLAQNHPNPFNPTTTFEYGVAATGAGALADVRLEIFDAKGRLVRRLVHGAQAPGNYRALWDGRDDAGAAVGSGIYFSRLRSGGAVVTRKAILVK